MITLLTFVLCSMTPAQDAVPKAEVPARSEWVDVDRVVMIVNQDIITWRQLTKDLARYQRENPIRNASERRAVESRVLTDHVRQRLAVQAGQDLGVDEKFLDQRVKDTLERKIESTNGVVGMSKLLQSMDLSSQDARRIFKEDLYAQMWRDSVTGDGGTPGSRPAFDSFVRPGFLKFQYLRATQSPTTFAAIGGKPEQVVLQTLVIDVDGAGGMENARTLTLQLKQRIEGGEDMGVLVERYSASNEDKGLSPPVDTQRLAGIDAAVAAFVARATPGELSDVLPPVRNERKTYLRLVRLVERTPPEKPALADAAVQHRIAENVGKNLEAYRLDRAYNRLLRAAYVWPKELVGE